MITTSNISFDATQHSISSVTVFQSDRAEVTRLVNVELKAGQNHVTIENLPSCLLEESIRADGTGNAAIFDVVYKLVPPITPVDPPELVRLFAERTALSARWERFNAQSSILKNYTDSLRSEHTSVETIKDVFDLFHSTEEAIYNGKVEANEKIAKYDEQIKKHRAALSAGIDNKRRAQVTVVVLAEVDGPVEILLSYVVTAAKWTPMYDLRAHLSNNSKEESILSVHYRASIDQSTGEDWKNVALTLSTASPLVGATIPELQPARLRPMPTYPITRGAVRRSPGGGGEQMRSRSMVSDESDAPVPPPRMHMLSAVVNPDEGTGNATFGIQGLSTIPTGTIETSQTHKVTVTEVDLVAELEWIVVPKGLRSAFLQCRTKNTSEFVFLPGPTNIFMGSNFVTKSNMKHVSPQESFSCSLGVDAAVKVVYHPQLRKAKTSGNWTGSKTETTVFTQRTSIKNTRQSPLRRLTIKDQVPISEEESLKVTILDPSSLNAAGKGQTLKDSSLPKSMTGPGVRWVQKNEDGTGGDSENGIVEWVYDAVEPGKSIETTLSWEITAPVGVRWIY